MYSVLAAATLGYLGYRLSKRTPHTRKSQWRSHGPRPEQSAPATRAQRRGEAGEAAVRAELRRVLTNLCGDNFYVHDGAVLVHHAPGTPFPTAEIDHIAVTPFGIFVVETKNWGGVIAPGANRDEVSRAGVDGALDIRRSPLAQNRTKVAFLNRKLPAVWPIEGLGVFAASDCALHPDLPLSLIRIDDLALWLRQRRHEFNALGRKPVNVRVAWQAIMLNASIDAVELGEHYKRVRVNRQVVTGNAV